MRQIDLIVLHCSDTVASMDIGADEIRRWHMSDPRTWSDIGYHFVIRRDGTLEQGRPIDIPGAHAYGYNAHSIGVVMVGGKSRGGAADCNFTQAQWAALDDTVRTLRSTYGQTTEVIGHRDLPGVGKACPTFDVNAYLTE